MANQAAFNQQDFDQVLARFMSKQPDMVYLLNTYGVRVPKDTPLKDVQLAFLKAIKDNPRFRQGVADYMTNAIQGGTLNFAGADDAYLNEVTIPGGQINTNYAAGTASQMGTSSSGTTSSGSSGSGWFSTVFSGQNVSNILNTGLTALSTKLTADANSKSESNALASQQLAIQQLQEQQRLAELQNQGAAAKSKGMPGWGWALIGIGVVAAITIVTVVIVKKNRARRAAKAA